jgi:hypothetical protein
MKSQLFFSKMDLHSNPSNFEIGTVIKYANFYLAYNNLGQRIGCDLILNRIGNYLSMFRFDNNSIYFDTGKLVEIKNYRFEIKRQEEENKMSSLYYGESSSLNEGVNLYDNSFHYLFHEIMYDYFKILSENKEQIKILEKSTLFNEEIFIDFLAVKNIFNIDFTGNTFINAFFKHIIEEINSLQKTGKTNIQFETMSEYIFDYFKNSEPIKKILIFL